MITWPQRAIAVLAASVAAVLGGCASDADPIPPVPVIVNSRDAGGADPCRLLTGAQLGRLGMAATGAVVPAAEGPRCEWPGRGGARLGLTLYLNGDGLATLARNSEPTTRRVRVSGYPALETFTGRGEFCQYDVGIAERQVVMVSLDAPAADSCATLQGIVPLVTANLPAAGRS